jgi:murein DD-endopeptidase MepM/ murein hydrolase activator NlpD
LRLRVCTGATYMKNVLGVVLLMLLGGLSSGYISSARAENYLDNYSIKSTSAGSMVFPVAGKKSRIGSFWGAVREGGARRHEGIDIFAPKKTPVVAVKDGVITTIGNGGRGGKYIWLKSYDDKYTYYYAHLDQQHVKPGQAVKKGEVIGTVGNTGNAKLTPPHLHFGMYSYAGAVDPLPFVQKSPKLPIAPSPKSELLAAKPKSKTTPTVSSIDPKYVWKKIHLPADPASKYFVTVRSNVVRVHKNELSVVGKYIKANSSKYPYRIVLNNKKQLLISKAGDIVTTSGRTVGEVI